jgi:hypothetical protein
MTDEQWNDLIARLAVHLYTVHGLPKEEFERLTLENSYWNLQKILIFIMKHKDFRKEIGWKQEKSAS